MGFLLKNIFKLFITDKYTLMILLWSVHIHSNLKALNAIKTLGIKSQLNENLLTERQTCHWSFLPQFTQGSCCRLLWGQEEPRFFSHTQQLNAKSERTVSVIFWLKLHKSLFIWKRVNILYPRCQLHYHFFIFLYEFNYLTFYIQFQMVATYYSNNEDYYLLSTNLCVWFHVFYRL